MAIRTVYAAVASALLIGVTSPAYAVATDCPTARDAFGRVRDVTDKALRSYAECVRASDGDDTCGQEFRRLKVAQHALENAGNDVHVNCAPE